jgi:hypothetical protein
MPHPNPEQRARVEAETLEQRGFDAQHLLADVHDESVNAGGETAPLCRTIAKFASLLVVLSDQADRQTKSVVSLTKWLLGLTVALLILTAYLSYDAYEKAHQNKVYYPQRMQTKP